MKKIISLVLCLGVIATGLAACTSKRYDPNANKKTTTTKKPTQQVTNPSEDETPEVTKHEIPEEEKVFTIALDGETTVKITGYTGTEESVVIPEKLTHEDLGLVTVTSIDTGAFFGNETIKSVTIGKNIKTIGDGAFQNCKNLTDVNLAEGVKTIGAYAFVGSGLTNMTIPSTVTSIGQFAFSTQLAPTPWYEALTEEKVVVGDGILLKYNVPEGVTSVDISGVKTIAYYAFKNPVTLEVKVSSSLKSVDSMAVFMQSGVLADNFYFRIPAEEEKLAELMTTITYGYSTGDEEAPWDKEPVMEGPPGMA